MPRRGDHLDLEAALEAGHVNQFGNLLRLYRYAAIVDDPGQRRRAAVILELGKKGNLFELDPRGNVGWVVEQLARLRRGRATAQLQK